MNDEHLSAEAAVTLLQENAARLAALAEGQPAERLHAAPETGAWSPNDILAHIRACGRVWGGHIVKILAEDGPTFAGVSPRTWMKRTDYLTWSFGEALQAFQVERAELLRTLRVLTPADWERRATVTSYGQRHERTVRSYASQLSRHEWDHVQQIERALSSAVVESR